MPDKIHFRDGFVLDKSDIYVNDSTIRVFISYRNIYPSNVEAQLLAEYLSKVGFSDDRIFIDTKRLKAGDIWAQEIFNNIRKSDVLIVLLQAGAAGDESTAKSEWVQREVDVARGCNVSILPVKLIGESDVTITSEVTTYLAIRDHQFFEYGSFDYRKAKFYESSQQQAATDPTDQSGAIDVTASKAKAIHQDEEQVKAYRDTVQAHFDQLPDEEKAELLDDQKKKFNELVELILRLTHRTRLEQDKWHNELRQLRRKEHAKNVPSIDVVELNTQKTQRVHIATGDMTDFPSTVDGKDFQIDVIVNSENDHMQLARMHEFSSLSVTLRFKGAHFENGRLMDDHLQNELNQQVKAKFCEQGLPVPLGEVIVTHAGHCKSELRAKKHFRYIFHAATIRFDARYSDVPMIPIHSDLGIRSVVTNCLDNVTWVNDRLAKGESILLDERGQLQKLTAADARANPDPITSIVFPLFATGQAGRPVKKVIGPMLRGIKEWFDHHPDTTLTDVYVSVYAKDYIDAVKAEMQRLRDTIDEETH